MTEYQFMELWCSHCDTDYQVKWDLEHPSSPSTCPFCGSEIDYEEQEYDDSGC
tara:strand:+ start:457 stop:615 length:159 start_codon:yes stop_codon:yes gene_type:complete